MNPVFALGLASFHDKVTCVEDIETMDKFCGACYVPSASELIGFLQEIMVVVNRHITIIEMIEQIILIDFLLLYNSTLTPKLPARFRMTQT
jgi:hypothetical protein